MYLKLRIDNKTFLQLIEYFKSIITREKYENINWIKINDFVFAETNSLSYFPYN
jgi:hypothetical protein